MIRDQSWLISDFRVVRYHYTGHMVYVAQLAECLIVIQEVMGSTPIIHTNSSQRTRLRRMKQDGGMRVVDQNYLYLRSLMEKPQNTNLMIGSSTLSEGTKDDKKRRMTDVERRVARVHTKDRYSILIVLM